MIALGVPAAATATSGGVSQEQPAATTKADKAKIVRGRAVPPANAPRKVVRAIEAANRIVKGKPYCYGGGHRRWNSRCYDCSGAISYALGKKGARLIDAPMASGPFMRWGKRGRGRWITVYANPGHAYVVIAGLRLDTSMTAGDGPGWSARKLHRRGFRARHPRGL
ncbi:MAG: peptidoglycan endopeptidase [Solirubrobacterales bacterium]